MSIVVSPGFPGSPNCLILPCNCPSIANESPGGSFPESKVYNTTALGTLLVALTFSVLTKLALKFPSAAEVFHVIALSTSPNSLTVNSLSLATVGLNNDVVLLVKL